MRLQNKTNILLLTALMAAIISAFFIAVPPTKLFVTAYIFAMVGIAGLGLGSLYLLEAKKTYPWFAAFPLCIWSYLTTQVAFSAVVVACENLDYWSFSIKWFILFHIVFLAITLIILIALNAGKDIIEARGAEIGQKVFALKSLVADLEAAAEKLPSGKKEIMAAADALRYSDPMSDDALASFENAIKHSIVLIERAVEGGDGQGMAALCTTLQRQIKDRNNRVKLMK